MCVFNGHNLIFCIIIVYVDDLYNTIKNMTNATNYLKKCV